MVNGAGEWRIENYVNRSYTLVYRGTNQTCSSGVETDIIWQNVTNNGANAWSVGTPERIYVPAGAKRVRLTANFRMAYSTAGTKRIIRLKASGGSVPVFATFSGSPSGGIPASFGLAATISTPILKVSDLPSGSAGYFYLTFEHDAGGTLDIFGNQDHTNFQIEVIE